MSEELTLLQKLMTSKPPTRRIIEEPFMLVMPGWPYRVIFQKSVSVQLQGLSVASGSVPSSGGF